MDILDSSDEKIANRGQTEKQLKNLERGKQFTSEYQPPVQSLKRGWEKRRVKQEIMDEMTKLDNLTMEEFEALRKDIEKHPEKHTVREARLLRYMTREKFIKDYLDRNTGKAPQDIDITSGGKGMNKVLVEHIHHQAVEGVAEAKRIEEGDNHDAQLEDVKNSAIDAVIETTN